MNSFILLPTWFAVPLVTVLFNGLAAVGLIAVLRLWPVEPRRLHNDITGYISATIGIVYGVLSASIAVGALQSYDKATDAVDSEASLLVSVFVDAKALPAPTFDVVQKNLYDYAHEVVAVEWPQMRLGKEPVEARIYLFNVSEALAHFVPATPGQQVYLDQTLTRLNALYIARRLRVYLTSTGLSPVIWRFLISSSVITLGITFFFGVHNFRAHLAMCCLLATTMAFVFSLIIAVDHPFLRSSGIGPQPIEQAVRVMQHWGER